MVNDCLLLAGVAAGFAEFFGSVCGGIRFVDEKEREVRQGGGEFFSKFANFHRGIALGAIEAKGEANDEGADFTLGGDFDDAG